MPRALAIALLLFAQSQPLAAQNPEATYPIYGVDYRFERVRTPRVLDDAYDKGTIDLVTFVYRPLKNANGRLVVDLHGSTSGLVRAPDEPMGGRPPWLVPLLRRGYVVAVTARRGRGESGGTFIEECSTSTGACTLADNRRMAETALQDALASTDVVVADLLRRIRPTSGRVTLVGSSRGGVLALAFAARCPALVDGVIAVSPGWLSVADAWGVEENRKRMAMQSAMLRRLAPSYSGPTLWVNGARDPFYAQAVSRAFYDIWTQAGGQGRWHFVDRHDAASGHIPPLATWSTALDGFLDALHAPAGN